MRPKVVAAILLLAICVLGTALLIPRAFHRGQVTEMPENVPVVPTQADVSPQKEIAVPILPPVSNLSAMTNIPATVAITPAIQGTNHAEYVQERVAELTSLAMNDDANSFDTIWSELSNPDKEIRAGALEAVIQFGDHSVGPRLRELAAQTQDPAEQSAILEAADYLDLPPITDLPRKQPKNNPKQSH
jgi:hypothetical protein